MLFLNFLYWWTPGACIAVEGLMKSHPYFIPAFSSFFSYRWTPGACVAMEPDKKPPLFYYRFLFIFSYCWTLDPNQPTSKTAAGRVQSLNRSCGYVTHQHWRWSLPLEVKSFLSNTVGHFGLVLIRAIFAILVCVCIVLHLCVCYYTDTATVANEPQHAVSQFVVCAVHVMCAGMNQNWG